MPTPTPPRQSRIPSPESPSSSPTPNPLGLITLLLLPLAAPALIDPPAPPRNAVELALEGTGISPARLQPDPFQIIASSTAAARPPLLRAIQADPLAAGYRVGMVAERFEHRSDSPHRLFIYTAGLTGNSIARGYHGNPFRQIDTTLLNAEDPLAAALAMIAQVTEPFPYEDTLPSFQQLPNPLRHEFARLLAAISSAERFRKRALRNIPVEHDNLLPTLEQIFANRFDDFEGTDYRLFIRDVEYEALYAGMLDLILALEDFEHALDNMEEIPTLDWYIATPLGEIHLSTRNEDSLYTTDDALLIVDLAGNDTYRLGSPDNPLRSGISIIFDREGDDRYYAFPGHGPSGLFGYGILWDGGGNDRHEGADLTQASAVFGASLLLSRGGDDVFRAVRGSQSFAVAGASLLVNYEGNDRYESVTYSQASAASHGAAVLFDLAGNDVYTLKNEPLISPSAQSRTHNNSMGQGVGTGLRADLSDGRSLPGGVGLLLDLAGDDTFEAQVFCQGTGFLEGAGILVSGGGNNRFSGVWYAQAAAAHRAAGVLISRGHGNDVYTAELYTSISAAHDNSVTYLHDEGGNDQFSVRNLGIGGANDNGIAIFINEAGNNTYEITDREGFGVGAAKISNWGTIRENALGVGLFFDLGGGENVYNLRREPPPRNAITHWPRRHPELLLRSEIGVAVDGIHPHPFRTRPRTQPDDYDDRILRDVRHDRRAYRQNIPPLPPPEPN